jgi:hypothetical protein
MTISALLGRYPRRVRKSGDLVKRNWKTIWLLLDGRAVKRHVRKDRVE